MMTTSREHWLAVLIPVFPKTAAWVKSAFKAKRNKKSFVFNMDFWGYDYFVVGVFKFFLKR